ncbi:MAG: protease HtpX [Candidatus Gracilibacteria bacterium]
MFKRVFLFLATNLAIMIVLSIAVMIVEKVFGINITGYLGGDYLGLFIFSLIFGFGGAFISLFMSKWMAKKAYSIKIIPISEYDNLNSKQKVVFDVVRELVEREHIKMPEVGFYNSPEPNAFATGATKNSSLVAVSSGLLQIMERDAIEGVIGHEMSHVLNGDMVTMTLLQGVLNTFVIFFARIAANIVSQAVDEKLSGIVYFITTIVFQIIFGILASLITMKFSRYREFKADAGSARFVGKQKMIAGLRALKSMQNLASTDDSKLATMKISTKGRKGFMILFSSHPQLDDRIKALEELNI